MGARNGDDEVYTIDNPVPARLRGQGMRELPRPLSWLFSWLFGPAKPVKGMAPSTTPDLEDVIRRVQEALPDAKWEQLPATLPTDDDGIWFFWLPDRPGEVQIESSCGVCPFIVETDKHDDRLTAESPADTAHAIIRWLQLPGGREQSPWHPR